MRFIIYLLFCSSCCYGYGLQNLLPQYFAHKAYKSGDFASSKLKYTQLLAKSPYDAELNYNLGTIFYKEKQYEDALSYLNRAVLHAKPNSTLHEQSLFNRANNLVAQKQFADAIKDYQKVLQINPDNQKASHNLKMVEQMLKDQDQQKNTKQNQQKSEDKNKEQSSSDKQKENKKNNEQSKNESSNSSVSQEQNQNSSDDKNEQENLSSNQQRNQSNENNDEQSKNQKRNQQENESKQQNKNQQQEKNANRQNNQQTEEDQASKLEKTKEKEVKHQQPLGEQSNKKDSLNSASSQEKNQELQKVQLDDACTEQILEQLRDDERLAERSVTLLEKLDEHEKNIQKKLLQMNVTKAGAQKYGQKNW